ncbi:MAG: nucleotide sugar dehydrogenase, UDPglucose 6-dehydrogenase [Candidatus Peregrinibacteria bacterium GW2011_GWF2_43_17]|nr:MAG: nucleotide sugar dehydrogenase, UDPglucose 6-dehydrogenase [Candidatus Peregrinibacteria bacterium GW2011_GWF2_43_17]KKT19631.1 MAG: UDP-glucose 6-dehydrogenase [Candidatus Peregrinibacteria bacterium GW2011_GWA2_43_8]HAU40076.1 UDP-glucose 6-dehydrogenase [Candidatus Peregrinibacteria bacterium]
MKIAVIGTGYVGLVTGTCLAELGNSVVCVDIDESKISKLKKGDIPIYEPGLSELTVRNFKEGRLKFTTDSKKAIQDSEVVFSAVGTPPDKDHKADLTAVKKVAETFGKNINGYKVFVNKSTVPVGTSEMVYEIIAKESKNKYKFDVVDNPEFLREGTAVKDFMNPDRVVVGIRKNTEKAKEVMEKVYSPLVRAGRPLMFTDIHSAEIIKYASNSFLATKISFINEVANFCELVGADVKEVAKGMGLDDRIGPRFLHAGIGYGGSCFPKDVQAFIKTGEDKGYEFQILNAVENVNRSQKTKILKNLTKEIPDLKNKVIAIWGLAFKPKTDDMREAPSINIINGILDAGGVVNAFDPVAMENAKKLFKKDTVNFCDTPHKAAKGADALLILTEWDEFRAVDLKKIKELMRGSLICDGRNIYNPAEVKKIGFKYKSIGR